MIEAYAFFAAFAAQIWVLSVLQPAWFARYVRAKAEVQLPGWKPKSRERFLAFYRVANIGIGLLGLVLLGWMFNYMQRPDWNADRVINLLRLYIPAQILPCSIVSLAGAWYKRKALRRTPPPTKRTASLRRHGLFDIVPPFAVFLAVLAYVLFVGFVVTVQQHAIPGFDGLRTVRGVSLVYALNAFCLYWLLYRRKKWPLETPAYRLQAVDVQVKLIFYVSFAVVAYLSLNVTLRLLHMPRWMPFASSVYSMTVMFLVSTVMVTLRRQAEADRLAGAPTPLVADFSEYYQ